jgi:hypothetical protein
MGTVGIGFGVSSNAINSPSPVLGVEEQLGTGTSLEDSYGPYNFYFRYSVWHGLYVAAEIGASRKQITGFDAYMDYDGSESSMEDIIIHVAHTTETSLPSTLKTDLTTSSGTFEYKDRITVYPQSNLSFSTFNGWKAFDFITNFSYNGINNLLITVEKRLGDFELSRPEWRYSTLGTGPGIPSANRSWYFESDATGGTDYPNLPKLGVSTILRPNIKLKF